MNSVMFLQREGTDIKRHVIIKDLQRDPSPAACAMSTSCAWT